MKGSLLCSLRKEAGLTQADLGEILRVTKHSICTYEHEKNQPSNDSLVRLAEYFDVSTDYLLGLTDDPTPRRTPGERYLRLPDGFPEEDRKELQNYMEYLIFRRKKSHPSDEA